MTVIERVTRAAKGGLASVVHRSGLLDAYRRSRRAASILLYHQVADSAMSWIDYSPDGMTVSASTFRAHVALLARDYEVMTLTGLLDRLEAGPELDGRQCVVTFDDAWRGVYRNALPALRAAGLPATVFVAPALLDGAAWYWEERIKFVLARVRDAVAHDGGPLSGDLEAALRAAGLEALVEGPDDAFPGRLLRSVQAARDLDPSLVETAIFAGEEWLAARGGPSEGPFVTWDELREMAGAGFEVGSHTVTHRNLTLCDERGAREELAASRERLAREIGRPVDLLAYPYGRWNDTALRLAGAAGYRAACATTRALVDRGSNRLALDRINIHEAVADSPSRFACRAASFAGLF